MGEQSGAWEEGCYLGEYELFIMSLGLDFNVFLIIDNFYR